MNRMICVSVEIREGALTRRIQITALSIERAMKIAQDSRAGRKVRLLFPIDPEAFFAPEGSGRKAAA